MIRKLFAAILIAAMPLAAAACDVNVDEDESGGRGDPHDDDGDCVTACSKGHDDCVTGCDDDGDCIRICADTEDECVTACD